MTEFDRLLDAGLRESEPILPATIAIDGVNYPGILSDLTADDIAIAGGFEENITAVFVLRKSAYPQRPRNGETYRVNGEKRRSGPVTDDGSAWNITLEAAKP